MNSRRRADLQRKLSLGAVPRPPEGLSERIKADIPEYLKPESAPEGAWGPFGTTMRIAAMVVMLFTSAFITLRILQPEKARESSLAQTKPLPAVLPMSEPPREAAASAAADEVRLEITESIPVPTTQIVATPPPARNTPAPQAATVPSAGAAPVQAERSVESDPSRARGDVGQLAGKLAEGVEAEPAITVSASAPPVATSAAASSAMMDAATPERRETAAAKRMAVPAAPQSAFARETSGADLQLAKTNRLFGVSTDPNAFRRIETIIAAGDHPEAGAVDVEGVLNYFAGEPVRRVNRGVALELEASPTPVGAQDNRAILRLTIDTASIARSAGRSIPPVATDARVEVVLNREAVLKWSRLGGATKLDGQATLFHNASVTALFALDLEPGTQRAEKIATVRLQYRDAADGRQHTIEKTIRKSDLVPTWREASRRHRLAVLGAKWAETLKGAEGAEDVAKRAEELSRQDPKDVRAKELAQIAVASQRAAGSSGTGGR